MPPKQRITKEAITNAAFSIIEKQGMKFLTARNVAKKMGISTRPIYFYFSCMQDLRKEMMRRAQEILSIYISKPYSNRISLNVASGFAFFARDHKMLYRHWFMENNEFKDLVDEFLMDLRNRMKKDKQLIHMSQKERDDLFNKMWIFIHGLASLIHVGLIEDDSDQFIIDTIDQMGSIVVTAAIKASLDKKKS